VSTCYTVKFLGEPRWDRKTSVLPGDTPNTARLEIWEDYDHFFAIELAISEVAEIKDRFDEFLKNAEAKAKAEDTTKEPMPF